MIERDGPSVTSCKLCPELVDSRSQIVNARGSQDANLILVGEAPGKHEDAQGTPFVGRSGEILDDTLRQLDVDPAMVRITNCVRCRPPENRDPHVDERDNCRGHLDYEIGQIDPAVLLTLGRVPAEVLLDEQITVTDRAGDVVGIPIAGTERTVVLGLHPAATLYNRSTRPAFEGALERAVDLANVR